MLILPESLFKLICGKLTSWIPDNREVSSAKHFVLAFRLSDKGEGIPE